MSKKTREQRRAERRNRANTYAQTTKGGFETTVLRMPEGVSFWTCKLGKRTIDIVPYITGEGNPKCEESGVEYFERTFWVYKDVGIEQKPYVCSSKTFGHPDFIQEWRQQEARNPDADTKLIKALAPKERQIFLVYDHDERDKGVQVWEFSSFLFGNLLASRIENSSDRQGWFNFYSPDEDGFSLQLTVEQGSVDGHTFNKVTAIDFIPRDEPLPEHIVNHGICLDDLLVECEYGELKSIFLGTANPKKDFEEQEKEEEKEESRPARKEKEKASEKEEDEDVHQKRKNKLPTADQYGIETKMDVYYHGDECSIVKISGDGTSLTLIREKDGEILKAIGPDEVVLDKPDDDGDDEVPFDAGDDPEDEGEWDADFD